MRAALLALVLLLGTLVPQAVQAHGGHAHEAAAPAAAPASAPPPAEESREALSAPCAPGGGGHVCSCGNLSLCDGRTQPPAAVAACALREVAAASQPVAAARAAPACPRPLFRAASPRAPPLSA